MSTSGNGKHTPRTRTELRNMPLISFQSLSLSSSLMCRTGAIPLHCVLCALQINSIHSIILIKYKSKCRRNFSIFNHSSSYFRVRLTAFSTLTNFYSSLPCVPRERSTCANRISIAKFSHVLGILDLERSIYQNAGVWAVHPSSDEYAMGRAGGRGYELDVMRK